MQKKPDPQNAVGAYVINDIVPGVTFDTLNPNNPIYLLPIPKGVDEPKMIRGTEKKTFLDVLGALGLSMETSIKTGDPDNPVEDITLQFNSMKDFVPDEIIANNSALNRLNVQKESAFKMMNRLSANEMFATALKDESKMKGFKQYLLDIAKKLKK